MFVQTYVQKIQGPWSLQGEKEFTLHKPQGKSLYTGTLFLGFVSLRPKAACALLQGKALSLQLTLLSSPRPLFLPFATNLVIFVKEGEYGCMQNWKKLEGVL